MAYTMYQVSKYLKAGDRIQLNGEAYLYVRRDGEYVELSGSTGNKVTVRYADFNNVPQMELALAEESRQLNLLIAVGGTVIAEADQGSLNPESGPILIEDFMGNYCIGCVKQIRMQFSQVGNQWYRYLDLCANAESRTVFNSLVAALPLLNTASGVNEDISLSITTIRNMYSLKGVDTAKLPAVAADDELAKNVPDPISSSVEAASSTLSTDDGKSSTENRIRTVEPFDVPYLITTQPDGYLPDMTDFTLERAGSVDNGWYSTVPIHGGRALNKGETLSAFLVNRQDGEIRRFDWVAPSDALAVDKWPGAFAQFIAGQGAAITAGAFSDDNDFSTAMKLSYVLNKGSLAINPLRIWSHVKYRAFSNAPFVANLVQALACNDDFQVTAGQTLSLQVRDLKTQVLYEQHFFDVANAQAGAGWSKPLCEQINRDSHLLRAGKFRDPFDAFSGSALIDDGNALVRSGNYHHITPADRGNAFWVPQCAELCVTLTVANWWESCKVDGTRALDLGTTLHAWVYDGFSGRMLAEHEWTPTPDQLQGGKWQAAWASALNTSPVAIYLRASALSPADDTLDVTANDEIRLWQRGDALRIFTSLPDAGNWSLARTPDLPERSVDNAPLRVTLRHPFSGQVLHSAVYTPTEGDEVDQIAWHLGLIKFLKAQRWPELQFQLEDQAQRQGDPGFRVPNFCDLQIDFEPVDEVEPQAAVVVVAPKVTIISSTGLLRITAGAHAGELEFRLNQVALAKGVRIAACVPVVASSADSAWPISVTADKVTWGARTVECTWEVTLVWPESVHGEPEQVVGHIGAYSETQFWQAVQPVSYIPPEALKPYEPITLLCEDYGNTERSEIFDTLGQGESGVDPRTGLFHAHYPVATLQGLNGLGPICDLTLHYSALRANEAGLGDGWAWRFSGLDVRDRCLTLANGVRITFTLEEWQDLENGTPLKKPHCLVRYDKDASQLTLDLPSGRREILSKPGVAGGDEEEPNAEFVSKVIQALNAIKEKSKPGFPAAPKHWTQWMLVFLSPANYFIGGALDYDEALRAWAVHGSVKELDERIAYYQRPFVQLVPSRIISLYGEAVDLEWKRQKGQFLLTSVKSGDKALFTGDYDVEPKNIAFGATSTRVTLQIWPHTAEHVEIQLTLNSQLLRSIERRDGKTHALMQKVDCDYADDPTLDRVLCRLTELDGSVECVQYRPGIRVNEKVRPLWPQAVLHALIPGDGQENQISTYRYTGRLVDTSDQLYIVEGERGSHDVRERHLLVYGLDKQTQRQEIIAGAASADSQWLEFKTRQANKAQVIRYTGYGEDLVKAIGQFKLDIRKGKVVLLTGPQWVKYQQAVIEIVWTYALQNRRKLIGSLQALVESGPVGAKAIDLLIIDQNEEGLLSRLVTKGQHTVHSAYYPVGGGQNIVSAAALNGLSGVSGIPQLSCPALPDYVARPLMAEYQCDDFGNSLGLKLFGYRTVQRGDRTYLELAQQLVIEGVGVEIKVEDPGADQNKAAEKNTVDGKLDSETKWVKAANDVLWRQRITRSSPVKPKTTPSGESKVREWSFTDRQETHLGTELFWLENTRTYEDNPVEPTITVRTTSKTQAGTETLNTERCSRYSQRCLERVEQGFETTWEYDAAGRVVGEARYRLLPGKNTRTAAQIPDESVWTEYLQDGRQATQIPNKGDVSRVYLDGLQRTWRSEWVRAGQSLPLYESSLRGVDESQVVGSWEWDYLPGGQAVIERAQVQAQRGRQPWVTAYGIEDVEEANAYKNNSAVSDEKAFEVFYKASGNISNNAASEFFTGLVKLQSMRDELYNEKIKSVIHFEENVCNGIAEVLAWGMVLFGLRSGYGLKLIKFAQAMTGCKGGKGIDTVLNRFKMMPDSYQYAEVLNNFNNNLLLAMPDMEDVNPWDFSAFLDENGAKEAHTRFAQSREPQVFEIGGDHSIKTFLAEKQGLGQQCLNKRTTEYLTKTNGTFERTRTLSDGNGQPQLTLIQCLDSNGRVVSSERVAGDTRRTHTLERDALGRVTRITRPDNSVVEQRYHGFSNHVTELKVDGKVVATQKVANDSTLQSRQVGGLAYSFADDTITLPDKTRLQTRVGATGVQWRANDGYVSSLRRTEDGTTFTNDLWEHEFLATTGLPGVVKQTQTTPRSQSRGVEWQSLRGVPVATLRADGHWLRSFVDHEGRVLRTCQDHEDVTYRYDSLGRLQSRHVQALKAGEQWQVDSEYNGFDQEVGRRFLHNGVLRFEQRMSWQADGRLASKASYEGGVLTTTERFSYDELDRLQRYTCEASDPARLPRDADGQAVKAQVFTWDALDNLVSCATTDADDAVATRAFTYGDSGDPLRMTALKRGPAAEAQAVTWSDNGYLKAVQAQGPTFSYNACGQLSRASDSQDGLLARYEYDGYQRLAAQYVQADQSSRELRYEGDELIGEIWFDKDRAVTRRTSLTAGLAQYDGDQVRWLIDDPQVGIAGQVKGGKLSLSPLLPFGEGTVLDEVVCGYNGMRRDPVTGHYHAGNGYRSYDPTLCRYAQPDWLSPFGEGGYNPYQHCPDPVNLHDPSGAIMLSRWEQNLVMQDLAKELEDTQTMEVGGKWRGMALSFVLTVAGVVASVFSGGTASLLIFGALTALSAVSFVLEVASVLTAESDPERSKNLGIASMVTGVLSAGCFIGTIKTGFSLLKQAISAVGRTARAIGRGAKSLGRSVVVFYRSQRNLVQVYRGVSGATRLPMRMRLRGFMGKMGDYIGARAASLGPAPNYGGSGWYGKLQSLVDPRSLTGRSARLYELANRSRFASAVSEGVGALIEVNILRGTVESSQALAEGDESASISPRAGGILRTDTPYRPPSLKPKFELWVALGLGG
jgi:RHS repeat-associated protein